MDTSQQEITPKDPLDKLLDEKFSYLCKSFMTNELKNFLFERIISRILGMKQGENGLLAFTFQPGQNNSDKKLAPNLISEENTGYLSKIIKYIIELQKLNEYIKVDAVNVTIETKTNYSNLEFQACCNNHYLAVINFNVLSIPDVDVYIKKYS